MGTSGPGQTYKTEPIYNNFNSKDDIATKIMLQLEAADDNGQVALALSIHYTYPHDNRESGHCVGFFYSEGRDRAAGGQFFDPNQGVKKCTDVGDLLGTYSNWLEKFLAGVTKADPNHPRGKSRLLRYFNL